MESPKVIKVQKASVNGTLKYLPFSTFESVIFLIKRINCVPGYQYNINSNHEDIQRQIFSEDDLKYLVEHFQHQKGYEYRRHMFYDRKMYVLNVVEGDTEENSEWKEGEVSYLKKFMGLNENLNLRIEEIDENQMKKYFNDSKYHIMNASDRIFVTGFTFFMKFLRMPIVKILVNKLFDMVLHSMERNYLKKRI